MPVPKHYKFMIDATFLTPSYESIAQFVRMVVRKEPFDSCVYGIDVGLFRFFKVYVRQYFPHHRGYGYPAGNDVISHFLFTRVAFQPVFIEYTQRFEFAAAHSRIKQEKQSA